MLFKNKIQLQITSSIHSNIKYLITYFLYILTQNKILNLKILHVCLPKRIKKFTILKSPHVFKTARTQIEIRTFKNIINITNFNTVNQIYIFKKIFYNLIKNLPVTTKLQITHFKLIFI